MGTEGSGDEKSEEKREQASTSYQYIFQWLIAVKQNGSTYSCCELQQGLPPK